MIKLENICKTYSGSKRALDDISFSVERGEICAYIGPNGAGKSTTMKILAGMLRPDSGKATVNGIDVISSPDEVKKITGYVPESGALFLSISPYDYLEFVCRMYEMNEAETERRIFTFLEIFGLKDEHATPMNSFSNGMRQKVLLISSLIHDPDIVLWDEPFSGLDYQTSLFIRDIVKQMAGEGKTFIYSTHVVETISKLCSRLILIESGKIIADEKLEGEASPETLVNKYFGSKLPEESKT